MMGIQESIQEFGEVIEEEEKESREIIEENEYESEAPTATKNRTCLPLTICKDNEYESHYLFQYLVQGY